MPDLSALPERGHLMLLMAILPMMLISTILAVSALDARGLLGQRRKVSLHVPLSAVAAGLALAAAVLHASGLWHETSAFGSQAFVLAVIGFQVAWAAGHLRLRNALTATVGMLGTGLVVAAWLVSRATAPAAASGVSLDDLALIGFQVALVLALVPQVAPSLAARLVEREMKVQRATVLSTFCLAVTALFVGVSLLG